ncbi:MAG: DUF4333 domain-containing protein [Gordonia sp. (in: high G+C Gram-positive bacteria)]|uniref:DUF4333 domain-containing protein n=1 Tax=Gordonia sp. (in: high G+C Gram-positive bacteria) TaxID=84139 RepID=UPI0039E3D8C9
MTEPQEPQSGDNATDPSEEVTQVVQTPSADEVTQVVESPAAPQQQYQYTVPGAAPQQPVAPPAGQPGVQYPVPPGAAAPQPGQPYGAPLQPGQYPQPGQPGQFPPVGQPFPGAPAKSGNTGKILTISGLTVLAIAALLAITAFFVPGWAPKKLSQAGAEKGVTQILKNDYQVQNVSNVRCPAEAQKVKKGESFSCTVTVDGRRQRVTLTFIDNKGGFEVGAPTS